MFVLNSDWLIGMLEKSSTKPELRILNLFDILNDWCAAPGINKVFLSELLETETPNELITFITQQAEQIKANAPSALAYQIVFLAKTALASKLSTNSDDVLSHAKATAKALIKAQREKEKIPLANILNINKKWPAYLTLSLIVVGLVIANMLAIEDKPSSTSISTNSNRLMQPVKEFSNNPKHTADMYASLETMRGGDCQFIEALQIPDADKKIYLENVVGGQVPTSFHEQVVAKKYMQQIRCNYTPMLMRSSTH